MITKVNEYFFGEEEITGSDSVWFYGFIGLCALIVLTITVQGWFI
jgi:hypothetical protein